MCIIIRPSYGGSENANRGVISAYDADRLVELQSHYGGVNVP
jgi:hypothetical protein